MNALVLLINLLILYFLYEFSDGRIKEECDANDWEYTANGVLYCE